GKNVQLEVSLRAETNSDFARGLGEGLAWVVQYAEPELKQEAASRCERNPHFARGYGFGHCFSYAYLSGEERLRVLDMARRDIEFARGLGEGFGFCNLFYEKEVMITTTTATATAAGAQAGGSNTATAMLGIENDSAFARGYGEGFGCAYEFVAPEKSESLFILAESNPGLSIGLGIGLGSTFSYLDIDYKEEMLARAQTSPTFAYGLGLGLGQRADFALPGLGLIRKVESIPAMCRGYLEGLGRRYESLDASTKEWAFNRALGGSNNSDFAKSFGMGLGRALRFADPAAAKEIFARAQGAADLSWGMGVAVGHSFPHMRHDARSAMVSEGESNPDFARGLGTGLGTSFQYLNDAGMSDAFVWADKSPDFARGLGTGLGASFGYLDEIVQESVMRVMGQGRPQLSFSLGRSIGENSHRLAPDALEKVLRAAGTNPDFARGLGTGLAASFQYLDGESQKRFEKFLPQQQQQQQ
ncbi:MAG: hypothetical protein AB1753_07245, partial [Thermoproteota archaeon]